MKTLPAILLLCALCCCAPLLQAQLNLVPNPSFEDTVACPTSNSQIYKSTGWITLCGSPDYYNSCNTNPNNVGVPNNWAGYQQPASGNAYSGFSTYANPPTNYREYPSCSLVSPLNIGSKYYVSFKVALALTSNVQANTASNKIGALFTMGSYTCNSIMNNTAHVFTDSIITDSLNWTIIKGSFIADSAYSRIVIGNFFDDVNTDTIIFFNDFTDNAYYFLDDICVGTDSNYVYNYTYTSIDEFDLDEIITCLPNPFVNKLKIQNYYNKELNIKIYNFMGELIYSSYSVSRKIIIIDLSKAKKGILLINIKSGQQASNYKLLKL